MKITPNTKIGASISAVIIGIISICTFIYRTTSWVDAKQAEIEARFRSIDDNAQKISDTLGRLTSDRFTLTAASEQALRWAIENPGLRVPDPRDPSKIIVVITKGSP